MKIKFSLIIPLFLFPLTCLAASIPDAGKLLREQPQAPTLQPEGVPEDYLPLTTTPKVDADVGDPKILVKGFRFTGSSLIPESELQDHVYLLTNQKLTFEQIHAVAQMVTRFYLDKGYMVRVVIPEQKVTDGIIELRVIEGKRGDVNINNEGERIQDDRALGFIDYRLAKGGLLNIHSLGEALNILNDQPGIQATLAIKPGAKEGEADLVLTTKEKPLTDTMISVNDNGSQSTGTTQVTASVVFNNPFGLFDAASLMLNASEGSTYVRGEYSLPLGYSGLRVGINVSHMEYDVIDGGFTALEPHGEATTAGLTVSYPLKRLKSESWNLFGGYNFQALKDYTTAGETGDTEVDAFSFGISGKRKDGFFGGGQSLFGLTLTTGEADLSGNASAFAADQAGRRADGSFTKLNYSYARQQVFSDKWQLAFNLKGQFTEDNLQSSKRFSLGGLNGVRGYPGGEASGDEGIIASANFIYDVNEQLNVTPFIDFGHIRVNKDNSILNTLPNNYELYGTGVAFNYKPNDKVTIDAIVAGPLGSNPGRDTNGNDSDGHNKDVRAYISITARF